MKPLLTGLEIANAGLTALDYGQSMRIQRNPGRYHEESCRWLLGEHPSREDYNLFFVGLWVVKPLVSALLPQKIETRWITVYPRYVWENIMIVNGAIVYSGNRREGL